MGRVLIVDDEPGMRRILVTNLRRDGHVAVEASGATEAKALLAKDEYDVILTDQKMPDGSGLDVLNAAREDDSTTSVIFLTAVGTLELAVESMRLGAFDFLTKPFVPDVVRSAVNRACERTALLRENAVLRTTVKKLEGTDEILGNSPGIRAAREMVARVAPTSSTVLITGETGTGKELVARAIHRNSARPGTHSSPSTARRLPKPCSRANSSAMKRARLPVPTRRGPVCLRRHTRERYFWTKLRRCLRQRRRNYCACSQMGRFSVSAQR